MAKKKADASPPKVKAAPKAGAKKAAKAPTAKAPTAAAAASGASNAGASTEAAAGGAAKLAKKKPAPAAEPNGGFTSTRIGETAGEVWRVLSDGGPQTFPELKKSVGAPAEILAAAIGWLAREGKLAFETNGRSVTVSLV